MANTVCYKRIFIVILSFMYVIVLYCLLLCGEMNLSIHGKLVVFPDLSCQYELR
jgi:hypothetical protein